MNIFLFSSFFLLVSNSPREETPYLNASQELKTKVLFLHPDSFLTAVPKVLADVYNSLGTQLPDALVAVLPADFFSDDSVAKDSISPSASSHAVSAQSLVSDDGLHNLRNRSANKRRRVFAKMLQEIGKIMKRVL